jgi:hypothetical protein
MDESNVFRFISDKTLRRALSNALVEQGFVCNQVSVKFSQRKKRLILDMGIRLMTDAEKLLWDERKNDAKPKLVIAGNDL